MQLREYKIEDQKLVWTKGMFSIPFVSISNSGVKSVDIITALIDHFTEMNQGDLKNEETTQAIGHLHAALDNLNKRTQDRQDRGVLNTKKV